MKKMMMIVASLMMAGSLAVAADSREKKAENTTETDVSTNPLTGNTTVTETTEHEAKGAMGKHKMEKKTKTKKDKSGKVIEQETDVEAKAKANN